MKEPGKGRRGVRPEVGDPWIWVNDVCVCVSLDVPVGEYEKESVCVCLCMSLWVSVKVCVSIRMCEYVGRLAYGTRKGKILLAAKLGCSVRHRYMKLRL